MLGMSKHVFVFNAGISTKRVLPGGQFIQSRLSKPIEHSGVSQVGIRKNQPNTVNVVDSGVVSSVKGISGKYLKISGVEPSINENPRPDADHD